MLAHPTYERLIALGLPGMAKAFEEQRAAPDLAALSFEERIGIMADREAAERDSKRLIARLKFAALRQDACVEDIDLRTPRGLDRALLARLVAGDWIGRHQNCLITGPCGVGKSWIACALGHKAAATAAPSSTSASRASSRPWRSPAATAATPACSRRWGASTS